MNAIGIQTPETNNQQLSMKNYLSRTRRNKVGKEGEASELVVTGTEEMKVNPSIR